MGKLTDVLCRQAKYSPDGKGNKLRDGDGLHLKLTPAGGKSWKMDYRFAGKEKTLSLGAYPEVSLSGGIASRH